jgi:Leucine-rich repeat (LRR) protein
MHKFPNKISLTNRLRRALAGICLGLLVVSLGLTPVAQMQEAIAAPETFDCGNVTAIPEVECEALVALYDSTGGPSWRINTGWLETKTPCSWYGINCDQGTVRSILLGDWCGTHECGYSLNLTGAVPSQIGNFSNLELLDLSNNHLTSMPSEIGNLSHLVKLDLCYNDFNNMPPEIGNLSNLEELLLCSNRLNGLPPEIGDLGSLTYLNLDSDNLTSVPDEIGNLSALKTLYLYNNQLTSLPPGIGNLSALTSLWVWNNQLSGLPPEIGSLSNLEDLELSNNQITNLPAEIGNLSNLKNLSLSNNDLSKLPPKFGDLMGLENLGLDYNQLNSLIPEIGNLSSLGELYLGDNQLTDLPNEVGNLNNLNLLYIENNQLASLPPEFGSLTNLTTLNLSRNYLASLPVEIKNLARLNYFDLSGNLIESLPPEFGDLTALEYLHLGYNQLSSLPVEFLNLTNLTVLQIEYNRIMATDSRLKNFLNVKDPGWAYSQTIPPNDLHLINVGTDGLELGWTPIPYAAGEGYYELSYAVDQEGPYTIYGTTADKTTDSYELSSLPDSNAYYVRIRSQSPNYLSPLPYMWSEYSPVMAVLTLPITPDLNGSLVYTNEYGLSTEVEIPAGITSSDGTLYFSTQTGLKLPPILAFTGRDFNLGFYQDDTYTDDLLLSSPITLTLEYDESRWIEERLELIFWDSTRNTWIDATQTCSPAGTYDQQLDENRLVVTACRLGKYALVELRSASYLPIVYQDKGYLP